MANIYYALYLSTGEITSHGECPEELLAYQGGDDHFAIEVPSDSDYENTHYILAGVLTPLPDHAYSVSDWQIAGDGVDQCVISSLVNPTRIRVTPPLGIGLENAYYEIVTDGSFEFSTPVDGVYSLFIQAPLVQDETIEIQVGTGIVYVSTLGFDSTFNVPYANQAPIAVPSESFATTFNVPVVNAVEIVAVGTLNFVTTFNDAYGNDQIQVGLTTFAATFNVPTPIDYVDIPLITYITTFNAPVLPVTTNVPELEFATDFNVPTV